MDSRSCGADPQSEIQEMRRRLAEAEATLEAIRQGYVDAVVVSGSGGQEEVRSILNMGSLANSLFQQVAQPIFILDPQNRIQRMNPAAQALLGSEATGKAFMEALPLRVESGDPGSGGGHTLEQWISRGGHIEALDVNFDHPVLGTRFYLLDANPVEMGWDGEAAGIVTLMDITARKLAEIQLAVRGGQLRHQLSLLQSITDNIPEGLLLVDEDERVIFHNRAALRILERTESDVLGMEVGALFRPKADPDSPDYLDLDPTVNSSDSQYRAYIQRGGGQWLPVQFAFHPLKDKLEEASRILVLSDVSEVVSAEKALLQSVEKQQQSQKMEAIGRLAGGIAHDFNNLLLAILGFTDLSLSLAAKGTQLYENLNEVKRAGERAATLTAQLLAYSRKQMLNPKVHDLNQSVQDVQKMLARIIPETVRLGVDLNPLPLPTRIDQAKLQQVLVNMALNAKDAMPNGGALTLGTGYLRILLGDKTGLVGETRRESEEGIPPGDYAFVQVEDTGHGMDEAVLNHLFEPFFTTKEFGKGSGLGLSTAYGIIRQMGGHVQVFSAPGRGTRFKVYFPLAVGERTAQPDERAELPVRSDNGERILLVEDEVLVRRLLSKVLSDQGYQVIEAVDGEDALARLPGPGEQPLSLVITDLIMDNMGGLELAKRLSALRPGLDILFISGYAEDQHKLPMDGPERPFFAAKPFRPADFLNLVKSILEKKPESAGASR